MNDYDINLEGTNCLKKGCSSHLADLNGLGFYNLNSVNIGHNRYDSSRSIYAGNFQKTAKAKFSAMQYGAKSKVGYNWRVGQKFILSSDAAIKYSGISLSNYSETGAGDFGLNVTNNYFDFISSDLGLRLVGNLSPILETQFSTSWSRKLNNKGATAKTSFNGDSGSSQKSVGADILDNFYDIAAQLNIKTGKDKKLMVQYSLQRGNKFTNNIGSMQYVWSF